MPSPPRALKHCLDSETGYTQGASKYAKEGRDAVGELYRPLTRIPL